MASNKKRRIAALKTGLTAVALMLVAPGSASAREPRTKVILNGELAPVTFNDGDSFRVLSGAYKDAKARLAGYNTLESFGAVHQWGTWTAKEMYVLAKMSMMHARMGIWECTSDGKTDTYGRMLVQCPNLRLDLVRRGFAHVMSVDDTPGDEELIEAQREAQAARRGIWAHGVPDFILTSLHSVEEDLDGTGTYNRLVSTDDGHSVKWKHASKYDECDNVCQQIFDVHEDKVDEVTAALRADASVASIVGSLTDEDLRSVVADFAKYRHINRKIDKDNREALKARLMTFATDGSLGAQQSVDGSCMVHVPFKRRFGTGRASCLK